MKQDEKKKKVLSIASELERLGYPEIAAKLREAVTSGKTSDASTSTTDEGGEEGEEDTNHPSKKGGN